MSRFRTRGAVVVAIWAGINLLLAALLFVFTARDEVIERSIYFSSLAILVILSTGLLLAPRRRPARSTATPGGGQPANGAPATAFAAACLIGGLAWVFGLFIAYLALPLVAFCLARWRVEWSQHRGEES